MIVRRFGNNIPIRWAIERDGIAEDFSGLTLRLYIEEIGGPRFECEGFTTDGNVISYLWRAEDQKEPGTYSLILEEYENGTLVNTADEREAIHLTTSTQEQDGINAAAMFTTDIQGVVSSYGSLEALLAEARAKIEALTGLNANAQAQLDALASRINYLNETMRQAAEYQLTFGTAGKPYTDAKFAEVVAQQQQQFLAMQEQMRMLIASGLEGFGDSISPLSIQAMMAIFGSEALQYEFINNINGNGDGSYTVVDYRPKVRTLYSGDAVYTNSDEVIYDGYYYTHNNSNTQGTPPTDSNVWTRGAAAASEYAEVFLTATVVLHHTLGINAVSPSFDVHQYKRWAIASDVHLPMPQDNQGYYIYIKADKAMTADADSSSDNGGATGAAEFIITAEGHEMDPGDRYYYFLYATVNALSAGKRVIATWNGFTSIKPGEIQANKFISSDGTQFTDYLAKSWRIGGTGPNAPFIEWNLDYGDGPSGELRMRGVIQQLPDGEKAVIPRWRGQYNSTKYYYYGDVVYHNGSAWIMNNPGVPSVIGQEPSLANTNYWGAWSLKGEDGDDGAPGTPGANGSPGTPGANGTNGVSVATVTIFKRSAGVPNGPSANCTYNVETGALTGGLNGWTTDIDSLTGTDPCWACVANIQTRDTTVTIYPYGSANTPQWSGPTRFTGTDGVPGANGMTRYTVNIYHQGVSTAAPTLPSNTADYNPDDGEFDPELNNGWSPYIDPVGGPVCWESHAILESDDLDEAISVTPSMWSSPIRLTGDTGLMGKVMRGVNEYSTSGVKLPDGSGYEDYQGLYDTDTTHIYYDIVYMGSGSSRNYYYCVRSAGYVNNVWRYAKEVAPNSAAGASFWQAANNFQFVATNVLLAWDAYIDCLSGNAIYMKGSNDNIVAGVQGGDGTGTINFFAGTNISGSSDASTRLGNIETAPFRIGYDGHLVATDAEISGKIECLGNNFTDENDDQYAIKSGNGLWVEGHSRLEEVSALAVDASSIDAQGDAPNRLYSRKSISDGSSVTAFGYALINTSVDEGYAGTVTIGTNNTNIANKAELKLRGADATLSRAGHAAENLLVCPTAKRIEVLSASAYAALATKDANTLYFITD